MITLKPNKLINYVRITDLKPIYISEELKKDYLEIDVVMHVAKNDFMSDSKFTVEEKYNHIYIK